MILIQIRNDLGQSIQSHAGVRLYARLITGKYWLGVIFGRTKQSPHRFEHLGCSLKTPEGLAVP